MSLSDVPDMQTQVTNHPSEERRSKEYIYINVIIYTLCDSTGKISKSKISFT